MAVQTNAEWLVQSLLSRAGGRTASLLLDYDGTLADIQARPELAHLPADTRAQLERLARSPAVHVAIVTGRSKPGLEAVAGEIPGAALAVNGGMQIASGADSWTHPEADQARVLIHQGAERLREAASHWPGTIVEDKELSLTVHYRLNPAAREALEREAAAIVEGSAGALRTLPGKESFELQPAIPWDKGFAIGHLLDRWQTGPASIFLGDDRIDEPAFRVVRERGGLACRVGAHSEATQAEWTLPSPEEVRRTISLLADALSEPGAP